MIKNFGYAIMTIIFVILFLFGLKKFLQPEPDKIQVIDYMETVEHDGHKFVIYREKLRNAGFGGLVHHPDCECQKRSAKD